MEQLKLLMDYTIFHLGVYITLSGLMVSLFEMKAFAGRLAAMRCYVVAAFSCFMLAGIFGGMVAGNIPYFTSLSDFTGASIGPWFATHAFRAWFCMKVEHTAFWFGVIVFLFGFWRTRRSTSAAV